jgi:hypothetical protein
MNNLLNLFSISLPFIFLFAAFLISRKIDNKESNISLPQRKKLAQLSMVLYFVGGVMCFYRCYVLLQNR